ncbi:MAG: hypothetical protein IT462_08475 [Planctomycetes bacterium]|nr:hypothetical protein [Planctomycetota bacterium]
MRYAPLAVVTVLAAAHALLTGAWAREAFDYGSDLALWRAIFYVELALPLFVLWPAVVKTRRDVAEFLLGVLACAAASSAVMFAFAYLSSPGPVWQSRPVVFACWALCGGFMALAARFGGAWPARARIALVCVLGLPLLWHYFSLEYAQKSQLGLQSLSPHWYLAANATLDGGSVIAPLAIAGALALIAAAVWPKRKEAA